MELCSIASGSSGNCIYVGDGETNLIVDTGISKKRIEMGLKSIDIDPEKLSGILITHEHSDHISGLGVMSRKYHLPIFATPETIQAISKVRSLGNIDSELFCPIFPDQDFFVNQVMVHPFSIPHDAANPVCYTFQKEKRKISVATDLGCFNDYIIAQLSGSEAILLEANHDINMLEVGGYPYALKRRILGNRGHLSNDNSGRLLRRLLHPGLRHIFLGHLSKENNYPELAYETVLLELRDSKFTAGCDYKVQVAKRDCPSEPAFV